MGPPSRSGLGDCRFYEQKFPKPEELVMVKVNRIESQGVYVSLLEYDDREGLILLSELSKRRYRSINKLVKVGRHEVVLVLRVDPVKGYIDLSKRRVSPEDIVKCEEKFSKSKKVHQTVRHIAQKHGISVEELNKICIWPLYHTYPHALDALKEAAVNSENVFKGLPISQDIIDSLIQDIQLRLTPQALKLRCTIDVWCFGPDGIDAVKLALKKAKDAHAEVSVRLVAPPQYEIVTSCHDKEKGIALMNKCLEAIETEIKAHNGGDFKQKCDIIIMGDDDEKHLEDLLEMHESSDEESDEEEDQEEEDEGMGLVDESLIPQDVEVNEEDED
ncbi:eukaryotic translation initiation factor 2 alpha subunit, putative [Theileria equi strain WA]|uniref:Eukaryotic translation initiation factor 2 subunit 1 n=1 Tax=Theileria equi strain WA TaxID=1537102 RepID=L1LFD6_THEEQ|nr:eukaryotic translation initiation factor 2 alpha subunit, putative [Theileria equi strain WA]EKX73965.1 eukaryotic translation initiation factor 2 alpha subunit, putative [Theileria equi strain WA]|eukprot:XP_004833417.1 eukaryotic translation initiation factor 2 alpha subunit, putative [Theileria equi strain WA]